MKIRTGFVSNSSTTSWIIAYHPDSLKFCEHCGRGDQDPLEMVRVIEAKTPPTNDIFDYENRIRFPDADSWIAHLKRQIEEWKAAVVELSSKPAGDVFYEKDLLESCTSEELEEMESSQPRVWEKIASYERGIQSAERSLVKLKRLTSQGYVVCSFVLKLDEAANRKLEDMIKRGVIIQVKEI